MEAMTGSTERFTAPMITSAGRHRKTIFLTGAIRVLSIRKPRIPGTAEQGDAAGARYCWQITYDLTDDEDIRKMMDKLPEEKS